MSLTRDQVVGMSEKLRACVRHEPCWTCDCLQGFLMQLELDADQDVSDMTDEFKMALRQLGGTKSSDSCLSFRNR